MDNMKQLETPGAAIPVAALGISISAAIDANRQIVFQTHLSRDCTTEELNTTLDKARIALDRQEAAIALEKLERQKELAEQSLADYHVQFTAITEKKVLEHQTSGKRGDYKPAGTDKAQHLQYMTQVKSSETNLKRLQTDIDRCKAKINGADLGSANVAS